MSVFGKLARQNHIDWCRSLIMFVIAWLIGLYVYEVAVGQYGQGVGIGLALLTLAVNGFARWRAMRSVGQTSAGFHFWMAVPLILFFGVPFVVKIVTYLQDEQAQPWWRYLASLLPFILKLGVPAAALGWIYVVLGRVRRRLPPEVGDGEPRPT